VRCNRLAKLFSKNYKVIFLTNKFSGNFNFIIKKHKKIYLNYKNSNSINSKIDREKVIKILKKFNGEKTIFVDHYKLDFKWQKNVSKHVDRLICINDYSKMNYCDVLINETYNSKNVSHRCLKKNTKILSGPKYAMIDDKIKKNSKSDGIFLFFGSVDKKNLTFKLINFLKNIANNKIYAIIGDRNRNRNKILSIKRKKLFIIKKYINLNFYLNKCDTAIIAGGSVIWETLYHNLKTIVIPTARNQYSNLKNLKQDKIIKTIYFNKLNENVIKSSLINKNLYIIRNLVDGNGLKRIFKEVTKKI